MPGIEDVYELEDGFPGVDREELVSPDPGRASVTTNDGLNRFEIRHAIEARREERRIARELDSLEFTMD